MGDCVSTLILFHIVTANDASERRKGHLYHFVGLLPFLELSPVSGFKFSQVLLEGAEVSCYWWVLTSVCSLSFVSIVGNWVVVFVVVFYILGCSLSKSFISCFAARFHSMFFCVLFVPVSILSFWFLHLQETLYEVYTNMYTYTQKSSRKQITMMFLRVHIFSNYKILSCLFHHTSSRLLIFGNGSKTYPIPYHNWCHVRGAKTPF